MENERSLLKQELSQFFDALFFRHRDGKHAAQLNASGFQGGLKKPGAFDCLLAVELVAFGHDEIDGSPFTKSHKDLIVDRFKATARVPQKEHVADLRAGKVGVH